MVIDDGFSMVIDSESTVTVVPNSMREKLLDPNANWSQEPRYVSGYAGEPIYQVSKPWDLHIGDGVKWSNWYKTDEIYS